MKDLISGGFVGWFGLADLLIPQSFLEACPARFFSTASRLNWEVMVYRNEVLVQICLADRVFNTVRIETDKRGHKWDRYQY